MGIHVGAERLDDVNGGGEHHAAVDVVRVNDSGVGRAQHWSTLLGATGANPVPSPIIGVKAQRVSYGSSTD
jgi:hypothetical protein